MASASDVPNRYDVVINGVGYMLLETEQKQATFAFAPTFLERTNISQAYGDDDQDFWLTMSQKDWSLGEGQRYLTASDEDSQRRYWKGTAVDVRQPGSVGIAPSATSITLAAAGIASTGAGTNVMHFATATNVYQVDLEGNITDRGAHGLAGSPSGGGSLVHDPGNDLYISDGSSVRKYSGSWANFDASNGAAHLAYLNNALYGFSGSALYRWSTAGSRSTLFTWQGADGAAAVNYLAGRSKALAAFGGDLAILFRSGQQAYGGNGEIWVYDGVAPAKVAGLPGGFSESEIIEHAGVLFISGSLTRSSGATSYYRPAVYVYVNGSITKLWESQSESTNAAVVSIASFRHGVIWTDESEGTLVFYDPDTGATTTVYSITTDSSTTTRPFASCGQAILFAPAASTAGRVFPGSSIASTATVTTSLFDGDTTRSKRFKSVVVEWDAATDGNGGSVDIAYRLNDLDGSFTSLQTGATSGTEYAIGQNARAIAIQVTLNKGTSTNGPRLKRIYVRAAPILDSFRLNQYVLNLTGRDGETPLTLRDGTQEPSDGLTLAQALTTAIQSTSAISITDEFGTYTALLDPPQCQIVRVRPQEYVAIVQARQV